MTSLTLVSIGVINPFVLLKVRFAEETNVAALQSLLIPEVRFHFK